MVPKTISFKDLNERNDKTINSNQSSMTKIGTGNVSLTNERQLMMPYYHDLKEFQQRVLSVFPMFPL